jgi:hypothetical protein
MPFHKGHPGYKKLGTKNKETLIKEERRALFDQWVSGTWQDTVSKLPPTYIADQFMGKATDKLEVSGEIRTTQLTPEQVEAINKIALDE